MLMANSVGLVPASTIELIVTGEVPVLVSTILGLRGLCVVATVGGNAMVVGETVRPSDPVTPVPERVIIAGLPEAPVYEIVTVAVRFPDVVGVKLALTLQLEKGASLVTVEQPVVMLKSLGFVPASTTPVMVKGELPVLVNVADWVALVKPLVSVGNCSEVSTSTAELVVATA